VEWQELNEEKLNPLEQELLTAGVAVQKEEQEKEEQRRQRELAQALAAAQEQRAREQTRAAQRLRWLAVALLLMVLIAGWVAWQAHAGTLRNQALLAQNYWSSAVSAAKQSEWLAAIHFSARATSEERDPLRRKAAVLNTQAFTSSVFLGTVVAPAHGAVFSRDESLVLTWSWDGTARLWRAADGSPVGQPMKHERAVAGATFNRDESLVLTWSYDGTARLWNIQADYDFPAERWPLFVEVATGTAMEDAGNVRALSADEWQQRKKEYAQIAEEHLTTCRYREANLYVKQKELWEGSRAEAGQPAHSSESHLNE
jgi:hypothetical protein